MTIREIIELLREQGHEITARERADGGLRITSIDGTKYEGSKGNEVARTMTGSKLSEARVKQLNVIIKGSSKKKSTQLPEDLKKEIKRVQRIFRKNKIKGMPTRKNIRYAYKHYGEQEAWRRLGQSERYAKGLAYDENIEWLMKHLEMYKDSESSSYIDRILQKIKSKKSVLTEDALQGIYQQLYAWQEGAIDLKDFFQNVMNILASL